MNSAAFLENHKSTATYVFIFFAILLANIYTPLWADDYCLMGANGFLEPLTIAWRLYFEWSGRFFPVAIMHYTMQMHENHVMTLFNVINAFLFVSVVRNIVFVVSRVQNNRQGIPVFVINSPEYIVLVVLMLWWLPRAIGEAALWKTGSIVYLWAVAGEFWIFRVLISDERPSWWKLPFVFIVANFLEPLSVLSTGVFLVALHFGLARNRTFARAVIAVHALGAAVLVLAPGNFVRAGTTVPSPLLDRIEGVVGNLGSLFDPIWVLAIAIIAVACAGGPSAATDGGGATLRWRERLLAVMSGGRGWVFLVAAMIYMALLLAVPRSALAARVSFPASVLLVCYLAAVFSGSNPTPARVGLVRWAVGAAVAATFVVVIPDLRHLHAIDARWAGDPQLRMGREHDAVLETFLINGKSVYARKHKFFEGVTKDPAHFINICYAKYHNVRTTVIR